MGHISGIRTRIYLIWVLLSKKTHDWVEIATQQSNIFDHNYHDCHANLNPCDFLKRIGNGSAFVADAFPDYTALRRHDFFSTSKDVEPFWSCETEVAEFLGDLTFMLDAKVVVETGCFVGVTSCYLAKALQHLGGERNLYIIDREKRYLDIACMNIECFGANNVSIYPIHGQTSDTNVLDQIPMAADLIFLDSEHSLSGAGKELDLYLPHLSPTGCLGLHDSIAWAGVRKALFQRKHNYDLMTFATSRGSGLSFITKRVI